MYEINETHDPNLKSWVESASDPNTDFPIQNLPFCVFLRTPRDGRPSYIRIGVAIGDFVFDISSAEADCEIFARTRGADVSNSTFDHAFLSGELMEDTALALSNFRLRLIEVLRENSDDNTKEVARRYLIPSAECNFLVPSEIGDYTDFYCSIYHATNVGSMFRPEAPLLPNYKYVPIGYHGRA
ncbi:MAG: fumarylacetoacetase, partial [Acidobacteriota bacterium]